MESTTRKTEGPDGRASEMRQCTDEMLQCLRDAYRRMHARGRVWQCWLSLELNKRDSAAEARAWAAAPQCSRPDAAFRPISRSHPSQPPASPCHPPACRLPFTTPLPALPSTR